MKFDFKSRVYRTMVFSLVLLFTSLILQDVFADTQSDLMKSTSTIESIEKQIQSGLAQELVEKRTSHEKHYRLKNGNFAAEIHASPIHYEDKNGLFQDVQSYFVKKDQAIKDPSVSKQVNNQAKLSNTLGAKSNTNSSYVAPYTHFMTEVNLDISQGYSIGNNENLLHLTPVGINEATAAIYNEQSDNLLYENVWTDTDMSLELTKSGFRSSIILNSENSPSEFRFKVEGQTQEFLSVDEINLFSVWLIDSDGKGLEVVQEFQTENNQTFLNLNVTNSSFSFPATITSNYGRIESINVKRTTYFQPNTQSSTTVDLTTYPLIGYENYHTFYPYEIHYIMDYSGAILFTFNKSKIKVVNAKVLNVGNVQFSGEIQGWIGNNPKISESNNLINIVQRWANGDNTSFLYFSNTNLPQYYDWSNAVLYVEYQNLTFSSPPLKPTGFKSIKSSPNEFTWDIPPANDVHVAYYKIYNGTEEVGMVYAPNNTFTYGGSYPHKLTVVAFDSFDQPSPPSNPIYRSKYNYDNNGRLISIELTFSSRWIFTYDDNGNLLGRTYVEDNF
ncbi:RHS repeat domain-containing protein [Paenibacillus sp. IITD108]|uniref:RHS repeat domain-containing protein n=1 Tax=Paenibacillus sp. IITD108 TaxID=3116649 RepID=UPI002F41178E